MNQAIGEGGGLIVFVIVRVKGCGAVVAYQPRCASLSNDLVNEAKRDPTHTVASARKRKKTKAKKATGTVETKNNLG